MSRRRREDEPEEVTLRRRVAYNPSRDRTNQHEHEDEEETNMWSVENVMGVLNRHKFKLLVATALAAFLYSESMVWTGCSSDKQLIRENDQYILASPACNDQHTKFQYRIDCAALDQEVRRPLYTSIGMCFLESQPFWMSVLVLYQWSSYIGIGLVLLLALWMFFSMAIRQAVVGITEPIVNNLAAIKRNREHPQLEAPARIMASPAPRNVPSYARLYARPHHGRHVAVEEIDD